MLEPRPNNRFLPALARLLRTIGDIGMVNSLSQVVAKIGLPGVPRLLSGQRAWDLSLVDPDNRRPIDFDHRRDSAGRGRSGAGALPCNSGSAPWRKCSDQWHDGRIKLLTTTGLRLAAERSGALPVGRYVPLATEITVDGDAIAFARIHDHRAELFVAPRLCARLFGEEPAAAARRGLEDVAPAAAARAGRPRPSGTSSAAQSLAPTSTADQSWLFLGQVFEHVPVGILRAL